MGLLVLDTSYVGSAALFGCVFVVLWYLWNLLRGLPAGLPPGPRWCRLPVVGSLPWIDNKQMHTQLRDWAKVYGGIYHLQMGNLLAIVLHDLNLIKKTFAMDECSGRPDTALLNYYTQNRTLGVLFSQGDVWRENRRFTLSCLRDFGMGKFTLESKISEEVKILLEVFEHEDNVTGFDPHCHVITSISAIICSIVFGKHYTHDDPDFRQYLSVLDEQVEYLSNGAAVSFLPFLGALPGSPLTKFKNNWDWLRTVWLEKEIEEHKQTIDANHPRDFIDCYLIKMQAMENSEGKSRSCMSEKQLTTLVADLFGAGTETTSNTLTWGLLYMMRYPHVQQKIQAELDDVVGRGRLPTTKDKPDLPYTHATVLEILRCSTVVPLGVLRATTQDTTLAGYDIPKHAVLIPNLWAVSHDPRYWDKPDEFRPERFLDADGKVMTNREALILFSSGTRICLGELLARAEVFLYIACVLQRFTIAPPEGSTMPDERGKLGITWAPLSYKLNCDCSLKQRCSIWY
ncbi:PREDICTED: cytochrome P450 2J2-like [Priapulus caudatus]|uniref:Cytochrome P450 2J2-like n=1 Tax=Priapulus caudatus TaxID=37621 RepID=A0ABM1DZP7_PRICU|nr:PREDICTED: cytochrome P450 2J2-like [Priapulus caudatus]